MKDTELPRKAPQSWIDALEKGRADIAAGRVSDVDLETLCLELEAEADALEAHLRQKSSAA